MKGGLSFSCTQTHTHTHKHTHTHTYTHTHTHIHAHTHTLLEVAVFFKAVFVADKVFLSLKPKALKIVPNIA